MEKRWTYYVVCTIIQIHFVRGVLEESSNAEEDIYVLPGSDVNLTCQAHKKSFLVQIQWSRLTDKMDLIALYHPTHGFYCANQSPCESLVAFRETPENVSEWTLHLRNISSSVTGKYKCSFTLYPEGIHTKIYNLFLQADVTQDEWRSSRTIEIEINRTLEIPCFQNISLEISPKLNFSWLVEGNGTQETLITQDHPISSSTFFKDRVKLGANYTLHLSPVHIHDDDQKFSCHIVVRPGKILASSTTVKVFAKPEIPMIVENNSMDVLGKRIFTCLLKNVFPTANLTWFIERNLLQGERKEIYIANEERKDKGGFLELKSVLTSLYDNKPAQSDNLTIWCMALSPVPGNKVWNNSSEKITFSLGSVNPPTEPLLSTAEVTLGIHPSPAHSTSPARYAAPPSTAFVDVSTSTPEVTPQSAQTSDSTVTTRGFNYSQTSSGKDPKYSSWMPSETYSPSSLGASSTIHGDIFTNTTVAFSEVPTTANGSTENNHMHIPAWNDPRLSSHLHLPSSMFAFKSPLEVICLVTRWRHSSPLRLCHTAELC
ncbi:T-cell surface protein tactile isoform X3 [Phacochoerus africanus]|uniref:T-cell surface protein tactile isoform X3 n=1 Tax=Phacochoerus africanus TaxID=41426 RepID=UPI001FD94931|nr:T-cell surface protein tactile isoform X3 [Phacochoerus africanus]